MSLKLSERASFKEVGLELSFKGRLGHRWGEAKRCSLKAGGMKPANTRTCMVCFQRIL